MFQYFTLFVRSNSVSLYNAAKILVQGVLYKYIFISFEYIARTKKSLDIFKLLFVFFVGMANFPKASFHLLIPEHKNYLHVSF